MLLAANSSLCKSLAQLHCIRQQLRREDVSGAGVLRKGAAETQSLASGRST